MADASPVSVTYLKRSLDLNTKGGQAVDEVKIAWDDITAFLNECFVLTYIAGQGFALLGRKQHPIWNWCVLDDIKVTGFMEDDPPHTGTSYPNGAKVVMTYKATLLSEGGGRDGNDPEPETGTYMTHERDASAEMMMIPRAGLVWASDNKPVNDDVDAGIMIPTITHTVTWHGVANPPWEKIYEALGRVNKSTFMGRTAGTILFAGARDSRSYDLDGSVKYQLSYTFVQKEIKDGGSTRGWNHFWRSGLDATKWDMLKHKGAGKYIYEDFEFDLLFRSA